MAIKLISSEWCGCVNDYRKEYIMDTDGDLANLPKCCTGSSAVVVGSGEVYMVNASENWVKFASEG